MTHYKTSSDISSAVCPMFTETAAYHICTDLKWRKLNKQKISFSFSLPRIIFLMFVSPTVSRKNKVSTKVALTILSRGITRSSRPNLEKDVCECLFSSARRKNKGVNCLSPILLLSPGGLADVSVPDVVGEDALGLVLQHLHAPRLAQARSLRLEQDNGLHAAALCRVWRHVAEP